MLGLEHPLEKDGADDERDANVNIVPEDAQQRLSTTPECLAESEFLNVEHDPIIAAWREFKLNSKKGGRQWVLIGAPADVPWDEHHIVADRLKPWRESYRDAPPERQEIIRRWLKEQQL